MIDLLIRCRLTFVYWFTRQTATGFALLTLIALMIIDLENPLQHVFSCLGGISHNYGYPSEYCPLSPLS
jgi:hypothetical protein